MSAPPDPVDTSAEASLAPPAPVDAPALVVLDAVPPDPPEMVRTTDESSEQAMAKHVKIWSSGDHLLIDTNRLRVIRAFSSVSDWSVAASRSKHSRSPVLGCRPAWCQRAACGCPWRGRPFETRCRYAKDRRPQCGT